MARQVAEVADEQVGRWVDLDRQTSPPEFCA
jgi:hypothetical protein